MPNDIQLKNLNKPQSPSMRIRYCDSFLCRLRGLTFRSHLDPDDGLLLVEARDSRIDTSIHMLFVPFDLTVVWINSDKVVVDKIIARSWRPAYFPKAPARYTLEIHPDRWDRFEVGDKVEWHDL
jgi:uncharacterized membrane protein (UPF0127 family)